MDMALLIAQRLPKICFLPHMVVGWERAGLEFIRVCKE